MTKTAAALNDLGRIITVTAFTIIALIIGLSTTTEAQAAIPTTAPVIEAGIPEDQECVLRDTAGVAYLVVSDTDPRCKVQGQEAQPVRTLVVVPDLSTIETTPVLCSTEQGPADGAFRWEACVPEESPNGGHITAGPFEDGSARYSDGYTISVKDETVLDAYAGATVGTWKAPAAKSDRELLTALAAR